MDEHLLNQNRYRDPAVVAKYVAQDGLHSAEQYLFGRYIKAGADILDVGVGGGRTTKFLAARAGSYLGIDYSEEMICACQLKFPEQKFLVLDASDMWGIRDEIFDV